MLGCLAQGGELDQGVFQSRVRKRENDAAQETEKQIDSVRNRILLSQTLTKWHALHENVLDLPNTAEKHRDHHLQAQALQVWLRQLKDKRLTDRLSGFTRSREESEVTRSWRKWRMELIRRRMERWQRDMRAGEKQFVKEKAQVLLRKAFQVSFSCS